MPKGIFAQFMQALRARWSEQLPDLIPLQMSLGPMLPERTTFYVGRTPRLRRHVFVNLQHNTKAQHVGEFTVNVLVSSVFAEPPAAGPRPTELGAEGSYRAGMVLHGKDKWWCLQQTAGSTHGLTWRPSSYDNPGDVITQAIADVTHDVRLVLTQLEQTA